MKKTVSGQRYHHIDLMEALGIWFVVSYHSTLYECNWMEETKLLYYARYYLQAILSTCVPLFFFANGYLLLNKPFELNKHIKRTIRIMVLTVIWGCIDLLLIMPIEHNFFSFGEFVENLVGFTPKGWINYLWFMGTMVTIYALFPLIKHVYDTKRSLFNYFVLMTMSFTFVYVFVKYAAIIIGYLTDSWSLSTFVCIVDQFSPFQGIYGFAFVYFCIGGMIKEKEEALLRLKYRKRLAALALALNWTLLFALGILFSTANGELWDTVWNGYDTAFTLMNTICIYCLCLDYKGNIRIIRTISTSTLGVYFIHMIFIHLTIEDVLEIPIACTWIGNAVYALLIVAVCVAITQGIKKIPVLNALVKL